MACKKKLQKKRCMFPTPCPTHPTAPPWGFGAPIQPELYSLKREKNMGSPGQRLGCLMPRLFGAQGRKRMFKSGSKWIVGQKMRQDQGLQPWLAGSSGTTWASINSMQSVKSWRTYSRWMSQLRFSRRVVGAGTGPSQEGCTPTHSSKTLTHVLCAHNTRARTHARTLRHAHTQTHARVHPPPQHAHTERHADRLTDNTTTQHNTAQHNNIVRHKMNYIYMSIHTCKRMKMHTNATHPENDAHKKHTTLMTSHPKGT